MYSDPESCRTYQCGMSKEEKEADTKRKIKLLEVLYPAIDEEIHAVNIRTRMLIFGIIVVTIIIILGAVWLGVVHAEETGTASYYTVASCLREGTSGIMANGERLNDESLVCASWFYSFGTQLRITNLHSGKFVIVTVKDRGPSKRLVKKGRIIDLSKLAFSRIGKLTDGVINVKVEVVK